MLGSRLQVTVAIIIVATASAAVLWDVPLPETSSTASPELTTFSSEQEFRSYVQQRETGTSYLGSAQSARSVQEQAATTDGTEADAGGSGGSQETTVERYSDTNIQEEGVQEPDMLKGDGETFFYSPDSPTYTTVRRSDVYYPGTQEANISTFDALPPENLSSVGEIPDNGDMFLHEDQLVVLTGDAVVGYDVTTPSSPEEEYRIEMNGSIVDARRIEGEIVLVQQQSVSRDRPCPIRPATGVSVACSSIYHPADPVPVDTTYTAMRIGVDDGDIDSTATMVGTDRNTEIYMSQNNLYLTYLDRASYSNLLIDYLTTDGRELVSDSLADRLEQIDEYDLTEQAKMTEIEQRLDQYLNSLSDDRRYELQDELESGLANYTAERKRQLTSTGIVKVGLDDLDVVANGEVPGQTLNQFSMDEHEGNLRIATTVGESGFASRQVDSANDLYVLGEDLQVRGSITDMGVTERIYSARFIDDTGYLVTFRQIDPFHVLDLSDPDNPTLEGELKLPGYSSYLHPLSEDRVLGIGEEDRQPKAVIFDVADPSDPVVENDYILEDYSSAIGQSHHAFLIDRRHEVFFLPSNSGGNIFNYTDGLEKITQIQIDDPQRARYVNDYLYIFSDHEVAVVDETDWSVVNTIRYRNETTYQDPYPIPEPRPDSGLE
ncbi:MAG: beta-propeller domain-containing protein [Candidatus Nanohaloarchaeota archaeon QJJ-5]|nr:beta-propeller domain-containing protein [Candidatus Nanohaloarchaeota archaeon QJJ-5]